MAIMLTGPKGTLAYWNESPTKQSKPIFGFQGRSRLEAKRCFARLSAFADNSNHAPAGYEGAVTNDQGLDLLFSIAGAR